MTAALLGVVAALAWGLHDFLGRFTTRTVGAGGTTLAVMLSGLACLSLWIIVAGKWRAIELGEGLLVAVCGGGYALAMLLLFAALKTGPLSLVSLIVGAYPATAVAIAIARGAQPDGNTLAGIAAVLFGMVLLVATAGRRQPPGPRENAAMAAILAFLSHLGFAVSITLGQSLSPLLGDAETTFLTRAAGLIVIALALAAARERPSAVQLMPWAPALIAMGALDVLALGAVIAAGALPASELAPVVSSGYGAVATLLGWSFLKERISPIQWLGIALAVAGTVLLAWPR
jgi:drug/metabolite transporter (DMT)-like permease